MKILKENVILNNSKQIESVVNKLAKEFIKWFGQDLSDYDNIDEFIGSKEFQLIDILQDEYGYEQSCLLPSDVENTIDFAMGDKETNRFYQFNPQFVEMIQDKIAELLNNSINKNESLNTSNKTIDIKKFVGKSKEEINKILDDAPVGTLITGVVDKNYDSKYDTHIEKVSAYESNYFNPISSPHDWKSLNTYWNVSGYKNNWISKDIFEIVNGNNEYYKIRENNISNTNHLKENINNSIDDTIILSVDEMIEGSMDNMSEDDIDRDITLYNRIGRILHVSNINNLICIIDQNDEFNPEYNKNASLEYSKKDIDVYLYQLDDSFDNMTICVNKLNGINYIFFSTIEDAELYIEETQAMNDDYGFEEDDSFNY